jgi:hypothetical protein
LISAEWGKLFPSSFNKVLPRDVSNHSPLAINFEHNGRFVNKPFRFGPFLFLRIDIYGLGSW